jgi:hypothetical protein
MISINNRNRHKIKGWNGILPDARQKGEGTVTWYKLTKNGVRLAGSRRQKISCTTPTRTVQDQRKSQCKWQRPVPTVSRGGQNRIITTMYKFSAKLNYEGDLDLNRYQEYLLIFASLSLRCVSVTLPPLVKKCPKSRGTARRRCPHLEA